MQDSAHPADRLFVVLGGALILDGILRAEAR